MTSETYPLPHEPLRALGVVAVAALAVGLALLGVHFDRRKALMRQPLHLTGPAPWGRIADADAYRLRVWGLVERELSLSLDEIHALAAVETDAPLACVVGWQDHALWRGVPIRDVVGRARPAAEGRFLVFRDDRDFSATLSMDYVESAVPLLAYAVNGRRLPREHGWPLRVVAPGKWGYKWVKWVTEIEVSDRGYEGTYESAGFSLDGELDEPKLEAEKR